MNKSDPAVYAELDPSLILDAIESLGFHCSGRLLALNSYENRVYQIGIEDEPALVAKFYRPGRWTNAIIQEEHDFALELAEHEIPLVAPLVMENNTTLHHFQNFRFALFPSWGGRILEVDNLSQLEWMGRYIGRLHAIGACRAFAHRGQLTPQSQGVEPYQYLMEHECVPAYLRDNYRQVVESVLQKVKAIFATLSDVKMLRLHGDLHAGNVLWDDTGPHIVDLDDCITGPAIQDIWMLLSGNDEDVQAQLEHILRGYRQFHDFNNQEVALIEPLRTLRMLNYSSWLASRWSDPAFPRNFPWFNTQRYWEEQLQNLNEQNYLLDQVWEK